MTKDQESIAAGNDYGRLGSLKPLNGTTRNAWVPVQLYNIHLQIQANHSTNHCIAFPMNGPVECLKQLPCLDEKYRPQVSFLGPGDEWMKKAGKYKYLYEMDTEIAYDWLWVWVDANHPSFQYCIIDTSDNVCDELNHVTEKIIEEAITTTDPDVIGISSVLDAEYKESSEGMCNIDHEAASPYTIHTAVLPKPFLIDANVNSAITAMLDIVQPKNDDVDEDETYDDVLPHEKYARNWPIIPVSRESNEPIVEWTDNKTVLTDAFPDRFLFGQGVPTGLPTQQNWKHFSLYYDGQFDDPLFIAHGFNQLQHACCIRYSARITGKNLATLKSLGALANSEEFWRQLIWARDHPHSQEAKSLNAKVSQILSMVGSTIPYSPLNVQ